MKTKPIIVLEALLQGHVVTMDGTNYVLDNNKLYMKCLQTNTKSKEEKQILLKVNLSIDNFIRECETLSFDESFIISSNVALTKIKRKR